MYDVLVGLLNAVGGQGIERDASQVCRHRTFDAEVAYRAFEDRDILLLKVNRTELQLVSSGINVLGATNYV